MSHDLTTLWVTCYLAVTVTGVRMSVCLLHSALPSHSSFLSLFLGASHYSPSWPGTHYVTAHAGPKLLVILLPQPPMSWG